jgi:hypothetical protein
MLSTIAQTGLWPTFVHLLLQGKHPQECHAVNSSVTSLWHPSVHHPLLRLSACLENLKSRCQHVVQTTLWHRSVHQPLVRVPLTLDQRCIVSAVCSCRQHQQPAEHSSFWRKQWPAVVFPTSATAAAAVVLSAGPAAAAAAAAAVVLSAGPAAGEFRPVLHHPT